MTFKKKTFSDKVQLRLRMTEDQINEQRRIDYARGQTRDTSPFFDEEVRSRYVGTTRTRNPYYSPRGHYLYHAGLARDIASKKLERKARRYWLRVAKKLEEKASGIEDR